MKVMHFSADKARDFTYSDGCGCRITFFANAEYATSRMDPGENCEVHTAAHQHAARDSFVAAGRAALAEYRHETETVRQYLMCKDHGTSELYAIRDGEDTSGYMPLRQALTLAQRRFGRVTLPVWNCDERQWGSEYVADPNY